MADKAELAVREDKDLEVLMPVASAEDLERAMQTFEGLKRSLLNERDVYDPDGKGSRIRKSGWRKLALAFGLSDEIVYESQERDPAKPDDWTWHVRVRVRARGGRTTEGVGSASSTERKYVHVEHETHAMAHTRAKSRAIADMLGSGDLVADELGEPLPPPLTPAARASQSEGFRGPGPGGAKDAGQRAIVVQYLEHILGEDLAELVDIATAGDEIEVLLDWSRTDEHGDAFQRAVRKWGYDVSDAARGLVVRLKRPKA